MITRGRRADSPVQQRARAARAARIAETANVRISGLILKIVLLGLTDALGVYSLLMLAAGKSWTVFGIVVVAMILINWIYLGKRHLAGKYLVPGLVFLLVFQIFAVLYSGYIAFTNYGTGHNSTKAQAVGALLQSAVTRVPDSPEYRLTVVERGGKVAFLVTAPNGSVEMGDARTPLHPVSDVTRDSSGEAVSVSGYTTMTLADMLDHQNEITQVSVPISHDPNAGVLQTADGRTGYVYRPTLRYNPTADTMTDTKTGVVYSNTGKGAFTAASGKELLPGWRINVGFGNFERAFTSSSIRGPLVSVTIWTFCFAILSVLTTFLLGLFFAIALNDKHVRGRKWYRAILILPYAFPSFLSALVWAGLMNTQFGFINQRLLGGSDVPWLTDPFLAKVSILTVNLWLGFPYMFLVCMGALQSIPGELEEAAHMDGASAWQTFRMIKFPLLLVSIAPLLISSFAYNFNNFNLIYMLTNGGPTDPNASINVGSTDILISMVYKIAFVGADHDYGLASAFSIIIFIVVAAVSAIGFRSSRSLEELN